MIAIRGLGDAIDDATTVPSGPGSGNVTPDTLAFWNAYIGPDPIDPAPTGLKLNSTLIIFAVVALGLAMMMSRR